MKRKLAQWSLMGTALCVALISQGQVVPLVDIQGQTDVSPYVGQTVTISGKVTEFFGDSWYMQDAFGAWNGVYVQGPNVVIPANSPYWNADRQPEVGDVLEITGTVAEVDGNTQIVDAELVDFVDFWNATPMGIWVTAPELQDEQYEGTRVRVDNATVLTTPDSEGYWTVSVEGGEVLCWGIDTYDPSGNEDPDGPTPGDVYQIYGASQQQGDVYVLHVGDIDVVSLGTSDAVVASVNSWTLFPNPTSDQLFMIPANPTRTSDVVCIAIHNAAGVLATTVCGSTWGQGLDISELPAGFYSAHVLSSGDVLAPPMRFLKLN